MTQITPIRGNPPPERNRPGIRDTSAQDVTRDPGPDRPWLRRAMIFGSVMASFNVEEFGTERIQRLTHEEINRRFRDFKRFTHFEEIPFERAVRAVQ